MLRQYALAGLAPSSAGGMTDPGGQVDPQCPQDRGLVVDHQHPGHESARGTGSTSRLATGSVTLTVSPPPGVSMAVIEPPMASVKPLATASPSPTPALRPSNRWNGSKMCGFSAAGTPGPWSTTSSTTVSPRRLACKAGGCSGGECLRALENRLART